MNPEHDAARLPSHAEGPIVPGARRGRDLGYPTANIAIDASLDLPADGVYLGWFHVTGGSSATGALPEEQRWPSLISIGTNPTFPGDDRTVEAHLLDFGDDLYGLRGHIAIDRMLRPQQTFTSAQELADAMRDDERRARRILNRAGHRLPFAAGNQT